MRDCCAEQCPLGWTGRLHIKTPQQQCYTSRQPTYHPSTVKCTVL